MPKQVLFVQGGGKGTHDEWDNKLVHSLETELGQNYSVRYPRMPNEGDPNYPAWKVALFEQFDELGDGAILVGHSIGGTFLIHALAEHQPKRKWGAIALIAPPFLGLGGWPSDEMAPPASLSEGLRIDVPVFIYHGTADGEVPLNHMRLYAAALPQATTHALAGRDHQLDNDLAEIARDLGNLG